MEIEDMKKQQIYGVIENPNLTKDEKIDEVAKILNKTDEEILLENNQKGIRALKEDLEEMYYSLFKKVEGDTNEDTKVK